MAMQVREFRAEGRRERFVAGALRRSLQLLFEPWVDLTLERMSRLQESGVSSVCEITADRWHVFQMHGGILRSADEALDRVAGFLDGVLGQRRAA